MPYDTLKDLPESVKNVLPEHGQKIYMEAFNNAWEQYKDSDSRKDKWVSREETAHKVSWSAVKNVYEKVDWKWVEK